MKSSAFFYRESRRTRDRADVVEKLLGLERKARGEDDRREEGVEKGVGREAERRGEAGRARGGAEEDAEEERGGGGREEGAQAARLEFILGSGR